MGLANLLVRSEFSINSSLLSIVEIARSSAENGYNGCSIADICSTSGFPELSYKCAIYGLKPVYCIEILLRGVFGQSYHRVILAALDRTGITNIFFLSKLANSSYPRETYEPVPFDELEAHSSGIALLACPDPQDGAN